MSAPPDPWLSVRSPAFVYVKIPAVAGIESDDRGLDEAIDQALTDRGLGSVLGWGSSLGERKADGSRPVAFHRIDVQVGELEVARAALHAMLPTLGVPAATELHYAVDDRHLHDVYDGPLWRLALPAPAPAY